MCFGWLVARLPQRLKSTFFAILHSAGPFGAAPFEKIKKMLILAFEANSALSRENETKIVKITHSAIYTLCVYRMYTLYLDGFFSPSLFNATLQAICRAICPKGRTIFLEKQ